MTYDPKTRTISMSGSSDFLADSGLFFVDVLRQEAAKPNAPDGIKADWRVLADWLGWDDSVLRGQAADQLSSAWRAYIAQGVAPTAQLQSTFDKLNRQRPSSASGLPPDEVIAVFDRLLATDRAVDRKQGQAKGNGNSGSRAPQPAGLSGSGEGWWRRKSKGFRSWVFTSVAWALLVLVFVAVFDPFNNGSWDYMDGEEVLQMLTVMCAPVVAGALKYAYEKLVR